MSAIVQPKNDHNPQPQDKHEVPFGSNAIRLSGWEWFIVIIACLVLFRAVPKLWSGVEQFEPESDYRMPYQLSSDYWLYDRYCNWANPRFDTLVIGDSVVWGHYVPQDQTLSHYLNQSVGRNCFANLGVDGIHPAAMSGLLRHYAGAVSGKNVILHLNPLWMSSPKHDLQTDKEFRFNHPKLVPQFSPKIPCYKDPYSKRIIIAAERSMPFFSWTSHLKISYFGNMDLPTWTLEHPYDCPLHAATINPPASTDDSLNERASWTQRGMAQQDFAWVELESSLQWRFFRQAVELLKVRGNTVFVLVGPFNEHMFRDESRSSYKTMKDRIETWLRQNSIPYYMPEALPSQLYHDASHPSSEGYAMLTKQLFENESFQSVILRGKADSTARHNLLPAQSLVSRSQ